MRRRAMLSMLAVMMAAGCGAGTGPYEPPEDGGRSAAVEASFLSASLSDDCPDSRAGAAEDCAEPADAGAGAARGPGLTGCGSFCRQTGMQLRFVAEAGGAAHTVEVVEVRLLDGRTDARLDTLTARAPAAWDEAGGGGYVAWDRQLAPGQTVRASWKLSAPRWGALGIPSYFGGGAARPLRLEVVLRIDGVTRVVRSGELTREPEVVT
jgi:hypothetical protein